MSPFRESCKWSIFDRLQGLLQSLVRLGQSAFSACSHTLSSKHAAFYPLRSSWSFYARVMREITETGAERMHKCRCQCAKSDTDVEAFTLFAYYAKGRLPDRRVDADPLMYRQRRLLASYSWDNSQRLAKD